MDQLRELGVDVWFNLGDRDLAIGLRRAERLARGRDAHRGARRARRGARASARACCRWPTPRSARASSPAGAGSTSRQFMIRERGEGPVDGVELRGRRGGARRRARRSRRSPRARAIVVGPSNPVISIRPILAVPGHGRGAARGAGAGRRASRPSSAARSSRARPRPFMAWAGQPLSAAGVAARLRRPARRHGRRRAGRRPPHARHRHAHGRRRRAPARRGGRRCASRRSLR